MNTIAISKAEVPTYLQSGEFFTSLSDDEDPEQQISIPSNTLKADNIVTSNADLHHLLSSLRFWGVSSVQEEVIKYCLSELESPCDDILQEFVEDFPYVSALMSVVSAGKYEKVMIAIESGFVEIVRNLPSNLAVTVFCCRVAAGDGNLEILQYLHERGGALDSSVLHAAVEGGNGLACVQYLRAQGVKWPGDALVTALTADNKECFHYALQDGCTWDKCPYFSFCEDHFVETLTYAVKYGYPVNTMVSASAAGNGAIKCLEYLQQISCPWDEEACAEAASNGHLAVLQYLHEHGCPWDASAYDLPTQEGNMEIIEYLCSNGCPFSSKLCTTAAHGGKLECLKYLHEHGCPWDDYTVYWAVIFKHTDCVQYALQQGFPVSPGTHCVAATGGCLSIVQCLHEAGAPWDQDTCKVAARNGHLDCLQYAHEHGAPWDESTFRRTLESGKLECLKYMLENGCPMETKECQNAVAQGECSQEAVDMVRSFHPDLL